MRTASIQLGLAHPAGSILRRHRGAVLLEVVVSVGLLFFGMVAVGLQVNAGLRVAHDADIKTRAVMLMDSATAALTSGDLQPDLTDIELRGDFGVPPAGNDGKLVIPQGGSAVAFRIGVGAAGYTWRMKFDPSDTEDLYMVTMQIGYNARRAEDQLDNPEEEIDIEDEGTLIVHEVYRLFAKPADINLERDFGFSLEDLAEAVPDGAAGGGGGDGGGAGGGGAGGLGDPLALLQQFLTSHPDLLTPDGGINPAAVARLSPEEFAMIAAMLDQMGVGGGVFGNGPGRPGGPGEGRRGGRGRNDGPDADGGGDGGPPADAPPSRVPRRRPADRGGAGNAN